MNKMKSKLMTLANRLVKSGMNRSLALRKAWYIVKSKALTTKVTGVLHGNCQKALETLSKYHQSDISITLKREPHNSHDTNAIAIYATLPSRSILFLGYIKKAVAFILAPLMDKGTVPQIKTVNVVGGFYDFVNYGARIAVAV